MNLNKGCIEIINQMICLQTLQLMNLNKGCIEIIILFSYYCLSPNDEP